jgi:hypothetical protein
MAETFVKISALPSQTTPDTNDVYPIVDTSASTTKKITQANLVASFLVGAKKITVGTSEPSSPNVGDLWIDTS